MAANGDLKKIVRQIKFFEPVRLEGFFFFFFTSLLFLLLIIYFLYFGNGVELAYGETRDDLFEGKCDLFEGKWVWDESYPLYNSTDCLFIDMGFRCSENGRPDYFFSKWQNVEETVGEEGTSEGGLGDSRYFVKGT